ncbi:tRNA (carboxymethyluridine(34)-5-O)-methyltransferase alkbh8 isoform 2-T2 [Clarias gariepinus]|uniref:alkylated DNA repair protein alkB homolog 8 isoform X2 n=1 Tax=Clarias gariepinus TaxID=13013 RepID=UPI00234E10BC|nr:alkylated DNA repair protein alkB homolog 8 isoform X2 [Clarias gariepinus]
MEAPAQRVQSARRSKEDKKLLKRQMKASHTLLKHEGITAASQPTQCVVVCNGGLGNGVSREQLMAVLTEGGAVVESLLMPPNKPYSFASFASVQDGRSAQARCHGRALQANDGHRVTLYCSYVLPVDRAVCECVSLPPGLCVLEDFVSPEEESRLLEAVNWTSHDDDVTARQELKHRRVKHYGYEFRYDNNNVDKDKPLPEGLPSECDAVLQRCVCNRLISVLPDQLTVNQYESGQGIPPHVDTHSAFEDTILSLGLGAKTVMDFRHPDGRSVSVVLPARSLLVMKGESRHLWTHGITPRKFDMVPASAAERSGVVNFDPRDLTLNQRRTRTSFTFRKIRHTPCDCAYPSACDSQRPPSPPRLPVARSDACRLEEQYVHHVYEEISAHFSSTRHAPWPRVRDFLLSLPTDAIMADIGCGNGKYLGINPQVFSLGCDRSVNLVSICAERGFHSVVCDALSVPLRSSAFDAVISIAVIHHFSTQERRLAAVKELVRLLKVGGRALIYVWAMEQEYKNQKSKYLKTNKNQENVENLENQENVELKSSEQSSEHRSSLDETKYEMSTRQVHAGKVSSTQAEEDCGTETPPRLNIHTNRTEFVSQDLLVPWHLKGEVKSSPGPVFHRFYHVFQRGELEDLCVSVSGVEVQQSYYDQGNWCVILQKTHQQ